MVLNYILHLHTSCRFQVANSLIAGADERYHVTCESPGLLVEDRYLVSDCIQSRDIYIPHFTGDKAN